MNILNRAPLVRLLFPFIAGILAAIYIGVKFPPLEITTIVLFLCILAFTFYKKISSNYKFRWLYGMSISLLFFFCGYQLTIANTAKFNKNNFENFISQSNYSLVRIDEPIVEKDKSVKVIGSVIAVQSHNKWKTTSGKALFYFQKDSLSLSLNYGAVVLVKNNFSEINPPQNPSEFNYKRYLFFHNIYLQSYIPSGTWLNTGSNNGDFIRAAAINSQKYFLNILKKYNIKGQNLAVASALVLGYKNNLDDETTMDYAASGALHVLSVSGLHVGIIYVVFNLLLFFFDKYRYGNWIKGILILSMLWFYAMLTGLSPSVLRASTMLSFVVIANVFNRNSSIYNTLAASAFLLLAINPYLIMEVGFQLSYLAVLGIVIVFPWIYQFLKPRNWLFDKIWTIIAVSISAQMVTFPLAMYYFHQFPNYFIFSNLVVIPLATVAIYVGILLFITGKITIVATFFAKIVLLLVGGLNFFVKEIRWMPYSLTQGISISVAETWMIYFVVLFALLYFMRKKISYLFIALSVFISLLSIQIFQQKSEQNQSEFIVYNISKTSACDFIKGKKNFLRADTSFLNNESAMLFHVKHNWWNKGIESHTLIGEDTIGKFARKNIFFKDNFVQFGTKKIFFVDDKTKFYTQNDIEKLKVDYVIVSHNPKVTIKTILKKVTFKKIIFDASNSVWKTNKWLEECKAEDVKAYSVANLGTFEETI